MTDTSTIHELTTRLADACGHTTAARAAVALAALDPRGAAQWLLHHGHEAAAAIPPSALAAVVTAIADTAGDTPGLLPQDDALSLFEEYGHLASSGGAADLARAARQGEADPALERALRKVCDRGPEKAELLRLAAELASAAGEVSRAHEFLTRLARCDRTMATLRYVHAERRRLPPTEHPEARIAILSSFTLDPLVPWIDLECRELGFEPHVFVAPFNTWEREMIGQGSGLERHEADVTFLAVSADDLLPALAASPSAADLEADGTAAVDRILQAVSRYASWSPAVTVVHSLWTAFRDPLGPAAGRDGPSRAEILGRLNARLAEGLRALPRAYLLDTVDVLVRRRHGAIDIPKMRHLARMRISETVLDELSRAYARFIGPAKGRTRKCVVVDLDNTLWGGIVGEDGPHGIRLGDTAPGSEYREFQQYLLSLTHKGFLLAINSKNNEADALEVIRSHESMVLREQSFSAMRINWDNKPTNMMSLADELGIGLDSMVFVDDSDKERALMRDALPQVLTPELPRDPALYRTTLEMLPDLHVLAVTETDRTRTRQYVERRQRHECRLSAQSLEEYLRSLQIVVELARASEQTQARVHQLFQRTNQFNLTGRRYELGLIADRTADESWRIYTARASDRFGDHGLVAAAMVQLAPSSWTVENLVMSCRVIGYGVEDALLAHVGAEARAESASSLVGLFTPTEKNAPARDFYPHNGFEPIDDDEAGARWERSLTDDVPATPAWIAKRVADDT